MLRASRSETWAMFGTLTLLAGLALPLACGDDTEAPTYLDVCDDPNVSCDGGAPKPGRGGTGGRGGAGARGGTGGKGGTGGISRVTDGGSRLPEDGSMRHDDAADDAGADSGS